MELEGVVEATILHPGDGLGGVSFSAFTCCRVPGGPGHLVLLVCD
jgi:hypothetical protein